MDTLPAASPASLELSGTSSLTPSAALEALTRENAYLRRRNAQLQDDLIAVTAESERLSQIVSRLHGRTPAPSAPNPLSGGQ